MYDDLREKYYIDTYSSQYLRGYNEQIEGVNIHLYADEQNRTIVEVRQNGVQTSEIMLKFGCGKLHVYNLEKKMQ